YCASTKIWHALALMVATLLPTLACVAIVNSLPLEPPDLGLAHSATLWIRGLPVVFIQSYALSWQFSDYVPELKISSRALVLTATAATVVTHVLALGLFALLWYPLPFTMILLAGPWIGTLALALKLSRRDFLREHPEVLQDF
ncbi:hypothetical protein PHYSODRAFT_442943, partial [Phytophthora sojae]